MAPTLTETFPHVEGVTHHYVESNGLTFHVAEAGTGEPLVLLHGWPQHWYMWRLVIPELAKHYRVIAPDLRGFGWSDAPRSGYEKETLALDMLDLLSEMGVEKFRLMGHDWGGWVGYLMCLRAPHRVSRYLSLAIPPPWGSDSQLKAIQNVWRLWYQVVLSTPLLGRGLLMSDRGNVARIILGASKIRDNFNSKVLGSYVERIKIPERARASQLLYRAFVTRELPASTVGRYRKEHLTVPTLSLLGGFDPAVPEAFASGSDKHADSMEIRVIEKSGHFIPEEVPDVVLDAALPFFAAAE